MQPKFQCSDIIVGIIMECNAKSSRVVLRTLYGFAKQMQCFKLIRSLIVLSLQFMGVLSFILLLMYPSYNSKQLQKKLNPNRMHKILLLEWKLSRQYFSTQDLDPSKVMLSFLLSIRTNLIAQEIRGSLLPSLSICQHVSGKFSYLVDSHTIVTIELTDESIITDESIYDSREARQN